MGAMRCFIHKDQKEGDSPTLGCYICCEIFIRKIKQENALKKLNEPMELDLRAQELIQYKRSLGRGGHQESK